MKLKEHDQPIPLMSFLKRIFSKPTSWRWLLIASVLFVIFTITFLGGIFYGAYLNKTGQTVQLNRLAMNLKRKDFKFVPNYVKGKLARVDHVDIDIKFKHLQKLEYHRDVSLNMGQVSPESKKERFPAKIRYNGKSHDVDLSFTGTWLSHVRMPHKWSYRVKVEKNDTLWGMKKFNLLHAGARGYLTDWIGHRLLKAQGLVALRYQFVDVAMNGKDLGLYVVEENFEKRLLEHNQQRDGILFKLKDSEYNGGRLIVYNEKEINSTPELLTRFHHLETLWQALLVGDLPPSKFFDMKKMGLFYAMADLLNGKHALFHFNSRFYFNPLTNLVEPIGREWGDIKIADPSNPQRLPSLIIDQPSGTVYHYDLFHDPIQKKILTDREFLTHYMQCLAEFAQREFLDEFFNTNEFEYAELLKAVYRDNPFYSNPKDALYALQRGIALKLFPEHSHVAPYLNSLQGSKLRLSLKKLDHLPIKIHHVLLNGSQKFYPSNRELSPFLTPPNAAVESVEFQASSSEEMTDAQVDNLELVFQVLGLPKIYKAKVLPWSMENSVTAATDLNPLSKEANFLDFGFIKVFEEKKEIVVQPGDSTIDHDLMIPAGYKFIVEAGTTLDLVKGASIFSYSPVFLLGKKDQEIKIHASDSTGQGLAVIRANHESILDHVIFENLANPSKNGWALTGAVTFYESPVKATNCQFTNNRSEDALNLFRSTFEIDQSHFRNIFSDAIDVDFGNGRIANSVFFITGNDAIDVSGTRIDLEEIVIASSGDKGISAGENSFMTAKKLDIRDTEIAVTSKDLSVIELEKAKISNCKIGLACFQKKPEFGAGSIKAANIMIEAAEIPHLIEKGSGFSLDGKKMVPSRTNVKNVLYGVEYGKSSKS